MNNLTQNLGAVKAAPVPSYSDLLISEVAGPREFSVASHVRLDDDFIDTWCKATSNSSWKTFTVLLRKRGARDHAFPEISEIMELTGHSERTVKTNLKELVKLGLIEVRAQFSARSGRQVANDYFFPVAPHKVNPGPLPKNNPHPVSKKASPTSKYKGRINTDQTNSVNAANRAAIVAGVVVQGKFFELLNGNGSPQNGDVSQNENAIQGESGEPNVSPAQAAILDELGALGALNGTTRRLALANLREAERQIERLRGAMKRGRGVPNPGGWFNRAMTVGFDDAPRPANGAAFKGASKGASDAAPAPDAPVGNGDARQEWVPKSAAPLASAQERRAAATSHIERALSGMNAPLRLCYETEMQGMDIAARVEHLRRLAPREWHDSQLKQ